MKRHVSTLSIAATAGAALLSVLPASAQNYNTFTQNFEASGSNTLLSAPYHSATSFGYYTAAYGAIKNTTPAAGQSYSFTTIGSGTTNYYSSFTNVTSGSQAERIGWQQSTDTTIGASGFYRSLTESSANFAGTAGSGPSVTTSPVLDLGGTVSFNVYVDTGTPGASGSPATGTPFGTPVAGGVRIQLGVTPGVSSSVNASNANALGTDGFTGSETTNTIYTIGSTTTVTLPGSTTTYPAGGHLVTSSVNGNGGAAGPFTTVTFNLPTESATLAQGTGTGFPTSGLGFLNEIDFTPVNPQPGEVYVIYIDDFKITPAAAPEPSSYAAMGLGALSLLGLALRARRRGVGPTAA